jgi:glycosyltransferase involved in cell wall biosynthesis
MRTNEKFRISIIQPFFNASEYLDSSINSVLSQTYQDFEYILVDDGSTDNSNIIVLKYASLDKRIRYLRLNENKGYNYALNYAISFSKNDYLFRIDSDDILATNALMNRIDVINNDSSVVLVSGVSKLFSNNNLEKGVTLFLPRTKDVISWLLIWGNPVTHSSAFFKKSLFDECGKYIQLKNLEDWSLWNKFKKYGSIVIINKNDIFYRCHENQSTKVNIKNPLFKYEVSKIINENLKSSINLELNQSQDILWALYYDTSLKDLELSDALSAIHVLKKAKIEFRKKYFIDKINLNELYFFLFLQKIRILSRLRKKNIRIIYLFICLIKNLPKIIFFNLNLTMQYLKYQYRINIFRNT